MHAVATVLQRRGHQVRSAAVLAGELRGQQAELLQRLEQLRVPVERLGRAELDRLTQGGTHQGVVLFVPPPREANLRDLEELVVERGNAVRLLLLDQVEDPRNLGACIRTADAAGIDAVVVPKARSARLSSAALKAATGAAETVPLVVVPNLARTLRWLQDAGLRLIGADERGQRSLFEADLTAPVAIVLGAEGRGLRRLTREACDELVRIPMAGSVDSLNVSVAAGVLLFESLRQQATVR